MSVRWPTFCNTVFACVQCLPYEVKAVKALFYMTCELRSATMNFISKVPILTTWVVHKFLLRQLFLHWNFALLCLFTCWFFISAFNKTSHSCSAIRRQNGKYQTISGTHTQLLATVDWKREVKSTVTCSPIEQSFPLAMPSKSGAGSRASRTVGGAEGTSFVIALWLHKGIHQLCAHLGVSRILEGSF